MQLVLCELVVSSSISLGAVLALLIERLHETSNSLMVLGQGGWGLNLVYIKVNQKDNQCNCPPTVFIRSETDFSVENFYLFIKIKVLIFSFLGQESWFSVIKIWTP